MKKILCLVAAALVSAGAAAQSTWTMGSNGGTTCGVNSGSNTTDGGGNVTSTTTKIDNCGTGGINSGTVQFDAYAFSTNVNSAGAFARAVLRDHGAYGIGASPLFAPLEGSPSHSLDNNGQTEVIALNFNQAVSVSSLRIGYYNTDSDVRVYRWTGGALTEGSPASFNPSTVGWELMKTADIDLEGTVSGLFPGNAAQKDTISVTSNYAASTTSSWWLVSAYIGGTSGNYNQGDDYFKLIGVSACTSLNPQTGVCAPTTVTKTPEPMSAALVGLALLGGFGARRLNRKV